LEALNPFPPSKAFQLRKVPKKEGDQKECVMNVKRKAQGKEERGAPSKSSFNKALPFPWEIGPGPPILLPWEPC